MSSEKNVVDMFATADGVISKEFFAFSRDHRVKTVRELLKSSSEVVRLIALGAVSEDMVGELLPEIKEIALDSQPELRIAALRALRFVDPFSITEIIADGLRDSDREVRRAAAVLFHSVRQAA